MKIKGAVLREFNKGYSIEELELDPPKQGKRSSSTPSPATATAT